MELPVSSPPNPSPAPVPASHDRWRERGVLLFGLLIIGAFFLPWVGNYDLLGLPTPNPRRFVPFRVALVSTEWVWLWLVPGSAAVLVISGLLRQPVKVLGFVTSGITLLVSLGLLVGLQSVNARFGPGGFLGIFSALGLLALLGEPPELKVEPEFVRLTSKPKGLIQHWFVYLEDFHTSAQEFYDQVEEEVKRRQLPKLELRRKLFFEGGLTSARREYLRLLRERVLFDICAAPFGTGFFFSYRVCEVPNHIGILELLALFFGGLMTLSLLFQAFGFFGGLVAAVVLFGVLGLLIWKSPRVQAGSLDDFLLNLHHRPDLLAVPPPHLSPARHAPDVSPRHRDHREAPGRRGHRRPRREARQTVPVRPDLRRSLRATAEGAGHRPRLADPDHHRCPRRMNC